MFGYLILGLVVLFVFLYYKDKRDRNIRKNNLRNYLKTLSGFISGQTIYSNGMDSAISIDETKKNVCFLKHVNNSILSTVVSFKDILSVEITEDDASVIKTSRSSQLGGTLLGGIAFGGLGAVIGGLSGSKTIENKVSSIDLKIIINNINHPLFIFNISNTPIEKNSLLYKNEIALADKWYAIFKVIIHQVDSEDTCVTIK